MKTLYFFLVLHLFTLSAMSQSETTTTAPPKVTNEYWEYEKKWERPKFEIGMGVYIPQAELANFINPSPFVDIDIYFPTLRNKSISLVLQFVKPSQQNEFILQNQDNADQIEAVESDFIINSFLRFSQNLTSAESISKVELGLGVGISTMIVQTPFSFFNDDDENASRGLVAFLIAPGIHWKFQPTKNTYITIGTDVNYSPYRLKGAIEQDIGGLAITPKILYRF